MYLCFAFCFYIKKRGAVTLILINYKMLLPLVSCSHTPSSLALLACELDVLTEGVS